MFLMWYFHIKYHIFRKELSEELQQDERDYESSTKFAEEYSQLVAENVSFRGHGEISLDFTAIIYK